MNEIQREDRVFKAGKAALGSAMGPAGLAIGGALLLAAAGAAAAVGSQALAAAPDGVRQVFMAGQAIPAIAGAVSAAYGLLTLAPTAAKNFIQSLRGELEVSAQDPKEALKKAWSAMGRQLGYGAGAVGYGAAVAAGYASLTQMGGTPWVIGSAAAAHLAASAALLAVQYDTPADIMGAAEFHARGLKNSVMERLDRWRASKTSAEQPASPKPGM